MIGWQRPLIRLCARLVPGGRASDERGWGWGAKYHLQGQSRIGHLHRQELHALLLHLDLLVCALPHRQLILALEGMWLGGTRRKEEAEKD